MLITAFALAIGAYLSGGSVLQDRIGSPDHAQQIEFYSLARWQRLIRLSSAVDDGYARLRNVRDGRVLGESDVFYVNGIGRVTWTKDSVDVGAAGRFDRRTGRWSQGEGAD